MRSLMGFKLPNRNAPFMENDIKDETYPMHPKSSRSENYKEPLRVSQNCKVPPTTFKLVPNATKLASLAPNSKTDSSIH